MGALVHLLLVLISNTTLMNCLLGIVSRFLIYCAQPVIGPPWFPHWGRVGRHITFVLSLRRGPVFSYGEGYCWSCLNTVLNSR